MMLSRGILFTRPISRASLRSNVRQVDKVQLGTRLTTSQFTPRTLPALRPISPRFASTSTPPNPTPSNVNIDTITFDNVDLSTASSTAAEGAGYLASLSPSLNYGWGITSTLEWTMEHLHFTAGLPWWGTITATALLCRLIAFPLNVKAQDQSAREAALVSVTKPLMEKANRASANSTEKTLALKEYWEKRKELDLKFSRLLSPMLVQGILGFCGFRLTRAMAELPVPGLSEGGLLWLKDLTVSDPYLLLPLIVGGASHLLFRFGGETGTASNQIPAMRNVLLYGVPVLMVVVGGFQPGTTMVWFAASTTFAFLQIKLLQNPAFRQWIGIAPIYRSPRTESPASLTQVLQNFGSQQEAPAQRRNLYAKPEYQPPGARKAIDVEPVQPAPISFFQTLTKSLKGSEPNAKQRAEQAYEQRKSRGR